MGVQTLHPCLPAASPWELRGAGISFGVDLAGIQHLLRGKKKKLAERWLLTAGIPAGSISPPCPVSAGTFFGGSCFGLGDKSLSWKIINL